MTRGNFFLMSNRREWLIDKMSKVLKILWNYLINYSVLWLSIHILLTADIVFIYVHFHNSLSSMHFLICCFRGLGKNCSLVCRSSMHWFRSEENLDQLDGTYRTNSMKQIFVYLFSSWPCFWINTMLDMLLFFLTL